MPSSRCTAATSPSSNTEFLTLLPLVGQSAYASPRLPAFGRALDGNLTCASLQQPTRARANSSAVIVANQYVQGVLTNLQAPPASSYIGQFWAGPGFGNTATLAASYASAAQNGQTTSGSTTITSLSSTSGLYVGQGVSGSGVPAGSYIMSLPSSSTVVINAAASVSASNVPLSFAAGYSFAGTTGGLPGGLQTYVGQSSAPARTVDSAVASVGGIDPTNTQVGVTMRQGVITDFVVGDVVLIINQQGDSTYNANVGAWELCQVAAVSPASFAITFAAPLANSYGQTSNTTLGNQKVVLYRVPEYGQLSVTSGGVVSPAAWDGLSGGVCALFAQQLICSGGGAVVASAYGYRAASDGVSAQSEGHLGGYNMPAISGNSGAALGSLQLGTPGGVGTSGGAITVNVQTLFANGGGGGGGGGQGGNAGSGGGHATAGVVGTGQGGGGGAGLSGQGWYANSGLAAGAAPSQGTGGVGAPGGSSGSANTSTTWGGGGSGGSASGVGAPPPAGVAVGAPQLPQLFMGGAGSAAGTGGYGGSGNAGGKITNTNTTSGVMYGGTGGGAGGNAGGTATGIPIGQGGAGGQATVSAGSGFQGSSGSSGNTAPSGGFGGNGGGIVLIFARGIDAAIIRSDGQQGGTGAAGAAGASSGTTPTATAAVTYGGAGGGGGGQAGSGGGAGGTVLLVAQRLGSIAAMTAAAGAGGAGGAGGAPGALGGTGQAGASGAAGAAAATGRIKVIYQSLGGAPSGASGADGAGVFTVSTPAAYKSTL